MFYCLMLVTKASYLYRFLTKNEKKRRLQKVGHLFKKVGHLSQKTPAGRTFNIL